jgi:hypothetical protein
LISLKNYSINGKLHREREGSNNAKIMKRWKKKKVAIFIQSYWSLSVGKKKALKAYTSGL